jgi:hypothetical protein
MKAVLVVQENISSIMTLNVDRMGCQSFQQACICYNTGTHCSTSMLPITAPERAFEQIKMRGGGMGT